MTWAALRHWVFRRGLISGTILGGLLGAFLLRQFGTVVGVVLGFLVGGAVAIGTGIILATILRFWRLNRSNYIVNMSIVGVLFVFSNILFTLLLVGGTPAIYGVRSISERISVMFQVGTIPALLSAISAIWHTPAVTDKALEIEAYRGAIS